MRARSRLGLVHNERRVARRFRFTHRPVPRYFSIQKVLRPDRVQVQVEQESGQVCVGTVDLAIGQARTVRFLLIANRPFFYRFITIRKVSIDISILVIVRLSFFLLSVVYL